MTQPNSLGLNPTDAHAQALFVYVIYGYLLAGWRTLRARGVADAASASYLSFVQRLYNLLLTTPQGKRKLKDQLDSARIELSQKLIRDKEDAVGASLGRNVAIPTQGRTKDDILHTFEQLEKIHRVDWQDGRVRCVCGNRIYSLARTD